MKRLFFFCLVAVSFLFCNNVYAANEILKEKVKTIYIKDDFRNEELSLYDYINKHEFEWGWLFDLKTEDMIKFIENPNFEALNNLNTDVKVFSYYSLFISIKPKNVNK